MAQKFNIIRNPGQLDISYYVWSLVHRSFYILLCGSAARPLISSSSHPFGSVSRTWSESFHRFVLPSSVAAASRDPSSQSACRAGTYYICCALAARLTSDPKTHPYSCQVPIKNEGWLYTIVIARKLYPILHWHYGHFLKK